MANVIGSGIARTLVDADGDAVLVSTEGRLAVETEQDDAFSTFVSYPVFTAHTTVEALNGSNHLNITNVADAKEIVIQTDDANTSYIMVGSSAGTTVAHGTIASRKGLKLNAGETLVIAIASFATIFIHAETGSQYVNVAYFK